MARVPFLTGIQMVGLVAVGCGGADRYQSDDQVLAASGQAGIAAAGRTETRATGSAGTPATLGTGPTAGLGRLSTAGTSAPSTANSAPATAGVSGAAQLAAAGAGGAGAHANVAGSGMLGSAGAAGVASGASGSPASAGSGAPGDLTDPTSVCAGGMVGMDSDAAKTTKVGGGANLAIMLLAKPPNKISRFVTTLTAPKLPSTRSTLFIWPGLQHNGGADPGNVGSGVLQPVLTLGPSCSPMARGKGSDYSGWWISGMYVTPASTCSGGEVMDVAIGERLWLEFVVKGTEWTQNIVNLTNMKKVDFKVDLKGEDQNVAIWDIEIPSSARPAEDTIWEKSVVTFTDPVTTCLPNADEADYFSAPVLSPDGLNCCFEKIIHKVRN